MTAGNQVYCAGTNCAANPNGDADLQGRWKVQFVNDYLDLLESPEEPPFDAYALLYRKASCNLLNLATRCYDYEDYAVLQTSVTSDSGEYGNGYRFVGTTFPVLARDGGAIPEPGSLALLGGALVAGWLTRRRKNA
jgi:hypothetical protein